MPMGGALRRQFRSAKYRLFGYSTSPPASEEWNREYQHGAWQRLDDLAELAHYSVILGYCCFFKSRSILDIGCGHGVMAKMLKAAPYEAYHGIDVSSHAVAAAEAGCGNAMTRFFLADAATYRPERRFDTVIFNECLYYFERPEALMVRYREFLEPGGRMIVSTFASGQERALLRLIESEAPLVDRTMVTNRKGQCWIVSVFGDRA